MGKGNIVFVLFFALALFFAKYKEDSSAKQLQPQNKPPAPKIIKKEQKKKQEKTQARVIRMKVTAYCPCKRCCGKWADGFTSTGRDAWRTDGVAADPKILPYFSELIIPGVGRRIVDDTGGAMRKSAKKGIYHIDLRFPLPAKVKKIPEEMEKCYQSAKEFGVRWLDVTVLDLKVPPKQ